MQMQLQVLPIELSQHHVLLLCVAVCLPLSRRHKFAVVCVCVPCCVEQEPVNPYLLRTGNSTAFAFELQVLGFKCTAKANRIQSNCSNSSSNSCSSKLNLPAEHQVYPRPQLQAHPHPHPHPLGTFCVVHKLDSAHYEQLKVFSDACGQLSTSLSLCSWCSLLTYNQINTLGRRV